MTAEHDKDNIGGAANPKQGAGSGVTKTSSTTGSEGPVTTRATGQGDPIVDDKGRTAVVPPSPRETEEDTKKGKE